MQIERRPNPKAMRTEVTLTTTAMIRINKIVHNMNSTTCFFCNEDSI
jgi:hypothetical protein